MFAPFSWEFGSEIALSWIFYRCVRLPDSVYVFEYVYFCIYIYIYTYSIYTVDLIHLASYCGAPSNRVAGIRLYSDVVFEGCWA